MFWQRLTGSNNRVGRKTCGHLICSNIITKSPAKIADKKKHKHNGHHTYKY